MRKILFLVLSACFVSACSTPEAQIADISFVVIGDTPYDEAEIAMLEKAVAKIRENPPPFVIHVGDYKGGKAVCTPDHDERQAALIASLKPIPVFYTPGDNEWTDCDRHINPETGQRFSDLARLERVRELFFDELPTVPAMFRYERQREQVENATWVYEDVRFITVHVVGTNNGRDWVTGDDLATVAAVVDARDRANQEWLRRQFANADEEGARAVVIAMQADPTANDTKPDDVMCTGAANSDDHTCDAFSLLRAQLRDAAREFERPVLVIHGDTAPFTLNQKFSGEEASNLWRLNGAGDAGIGATGLAYGVRDITQVGVNPAATVPFSASGYLTGKKPKTN